MPFVNVCQFYRVTEICEFQLTNTDPDILLGMTSPLAQPPMNYVICSKSSTSPAWHSNFHPPPSSQPSLPIATRWEHCCLGQKKLIASTTASPTAHSTPSTTRSSPAIPTSLLARMLDYKSGPSSGVNLRWEYMTTGVGSCIRQLKGCQTNDQNHPYSPIPIPYPSASVKTTLMNPKKTGFLRQAIKR